MKEKPFDLKFHEFERDMIELIGKSGMPLSVVVLSLSNLNSTLIQQLNASIQNMKKETEKEESKDGSTNS